MIRPFRVALVLGATALAGACGHETPTGVGDSLLTGGVTHTFEVVLDASSFLQSDTTMSGFITGTGTTSFLVAAQKFGAVVDAHVLTKFLPPASTITVLDSAGVSTTDTLPSYFEGSVVLHVDSTETNGNEPVLLQLFRAAQEFDPITATWQLAIDSGTVRQPWSTPGGTVGLLVDTVTYQPGDDSVVFHVDSATVAHWADTTNLARGALVAVGTPGGRLRFTTVDYTVSAHSSIQKDTVVSVTPGVSGAGFVFNPAVPSPATGVLQIGGIPPWRAFLTFQPDLVTRTMACPPSAGIGCTYTLRAVTINYAGLMLQPAPAGAWIPEDSLRPSAVTVDTSSLVPLSRSPLGPLLGTVTTSPSVFGSPPSSTPVTVPITTFVAAISGDTLRTGGSAPGQSNTLAVLHLPEPGMLGVGEFYGLEAGPALAPKLRLIITIAPEVQLP